MAQDQPAKEFPENIVALGESIVNLTLKEAKALSDYLEEVHGIKAAAGGAVMVAGPAAGGEEAAKVEEKTEFDVVLTDAGANRLNVIKAVRAATGASLGDAKAFVDGIPSKIKTAVPKDEAEKLKADLEAAGAKVEIK